MKTATRRLRFEKKKMQAFKKLEQFQKLMGQMHSLNGGERHDFRGPFQKPNALVSNAYGVLAKIKFQKGQ